MRPLKKYGPTPGRDWYTLNPTNKKEKRSGVWGEGPRTRVRKKKKRKTLGIVGSALIAGKMGEKTRL